MHISVFAGEYGIKFFGNNFNLLNLVGLFCLKESNIKTIDTETDWSYQYPCGTDKFYSVTHISGKIVIT